VSKHHRLVAELVRQLDDIVNLRRNSPNELFIDATDGGATVLDLDAIAKAVEMPSKKKLRKRYRKLEDRYENLYSKFQDAGARAWEADQARDKAERCASMLENVLTRCTSAWERQEALFEKELEQAETDVRTLLNDIGEPAFYDGTHEAGRVRAMRDRYGYPRDATPDDPPRPAEDSATPLEFRSIFADTVNRPIDRDIIERDGRRPEGKFGNPMWVADEEVEAEREAVEAYSRAHNHDMHPFCRETIAPDGTRRGECMKDAA
jgi:hypothetical protein